VIDDTEKSSRRNKIYAHASVGGRSDDFDGLKVRSSWMMSEQDYEERLFKPVL